MGQRGAGDGVVGQRSAGRRCVMGQCGATVCVCDGVMGRCGATVCDGAVG